MQRVSFLSPFNYFTNHMLQTVVTCVTILTLFSVCSENVRDEGIKNTRGRGFRELRKGWGFVTVLYKDYVCYALFIIS
jgi:hypothetical protein